MLVKGSVMLVQSGSISPNFMFTFEQFKENYSRSLSLNVRINLN